LVFLEIDMAKKRGDTPYVERRAIGQRERLIAPGKRQNVAQLIHAFSLKGLCLNGFML
jgi:hypothetical protein